MVGAAQGGGARLNFVGPKSVYARVGLQANDIVTSIDGKVLASGAEVAQTLHAAYGDGHVHEIKLIRNGKDKTIRFGKP